MILFNGHILPDEKLSEVLSALEEVCFQAIRDRRPIAAEVIDACAILSDRIAGGSFDDILRPLLAKGSFTNRQLEEAVAFFQREHMELKYHTELGILKEGLQPLSAPDGDIIYRRYVPLGILFHIAAGNAEGLPFYSVIEGLLAGNINLLKLPSVDDGLSVLLLRELIRIKPSLAPYIAVFDIPSTNGMVLKRLADLADAVVVWGGDAAVTAVRRLVDPSTQIISWGHKLSFAYVTRDATEKELRGLAAHICETNQLLCSSCQGIFLDTDDRAYVKEEGLRFLRLLEEESKAFPQLSIGVRGKISLSLYNEELEAAASGREVLRGRGVSVILSWDIRPELSYMFRNCWIKPLPRADIVRVLKPSKGYLQTAGLLCGEGDRKELSDRLIRAGVVRVTRGFAMSRAVPGEAHDGEYALRRYSRLVEEAL